MIQDYTIESVDTKIGAPTLKINNYYLHSKYNPIREAELFVEKHYKPSHIHILFGYGAGYIVNAFLNKLQKDEKLVVVEPILEDISIEHNDLTIFISHDIKKVSEKVTSTFRTINNITVICSPNYDKICQEDYKQFLSLLKDKLSLDKVNENTVIASSNEWQRNYLMNLEHVVKKDHSITTLKKYSSRPIVIASGGPSLTKQLPLIKQYREQFILIAAGSTINTLVSEAIEPDYIVSIDGWLANYNHFKELTFKNAQFIYSMYSHYGIRDSFEKKAFYFLSESAGKLLNHLSDSTGDEIGVLPGGGSVAHYALSVANYITTGPIALVGQDLAYTNNQSHAKNNKHFKLFTEEETKTKGLFEEEGYFGDTVLTDYSFLSMKRSFEGMKKKYQFNDHVFNCTEGGILIEGFEQIPFKSFCEKYVRNEINETFDSEENLSSNSDKVKILLNKMENEVEIYNKIEKVLKESIILLKKNKSKIAFEHSILKKLDKNDKVIEKYRLQTALTVSMDPINLNVLKYFSPKANETSMETYTRVYNQNMTLYEGYLNALDHARIYTNQLINNLKKELKDE